MNTRITASITWLIIGLSLCMHSALELMAEVYYSTPSAAEANTVTEVPMSMHIIFTVAMIIPMVMSFVTLFVENKGFILFSLIYSSVLILLNTVHFTEILGNLGNISQAVLMLFIVIANVFLSVTLNKWRKASKLLFAS